MAQLKLSRTLTNNKYTLTPEIVELTAQDSAQIEDFGEPVITAGGTIDVTSTVTQITLAANVTYTVGETVKDNLVTPTKTATVVKQVATALYVTPVTGTFADTNNIIGVTSGATTTVSGVPTTGVNKFKVVYNDDPSALNAYTPVSTANFSTSLAVRRIPSGWANGSTFWTFDGNKTAEAEENAKDFETVLKYLVAVAWNDLNAKLDNWEEPIPNPEYIAL